ncbi:MAG: hypothetical protein H0V16_02140 [Burkholderiaceae bacterium]|nr:hypothetical protein [Burkholderiaceae bacterium]
MSDWPTPQFVKQEKMLELEREARVRSKDKFAYTSEEAAKLLESKLNARAHDALGSWRRR